MGNLTTRVLGLLNSLLNRLLNRLLALLVVLFLGLLSSLLDRLRSPATLCRLNSFDSSWAP